MENDIWCWFDSEYKCHVNNREDYDKMLRWKRARAGGIYYIPNEPDEYDVIIPESLLDKALSLLKLEEVRYPNSSIFATKPVLNDNDLQERDLPEVGNSEGCTKYLKENIANVKRR